MLVYFVLVISFHQKCREKAYAYKRVEFDNTEPEPPHTPKQTSRILSV
jgi:hypothetical protein